MTMSRRLATFGMFVALVAPAAAQQTPPVRAGAGEPAKGDVGLTYSIMRLQGQTAPAGLGVDVSRTIGRSANDVGVQFAAALGINRFPATSNADYDFYAATQTSMLGGIRFVGRSDAPVLPFAQALAGVLHCCGSTDWAVEFGGGVDIPVRGTAAKLRIQIGVPTVYFGAGTDEDGAYAAGHSIGLRFNVGVAIPIGR